MKKAAAFVDSYCTVNKKVFYGQYKSGSFVDISYKYTLIHFQDPHQDTIGIREFCKTRCMRFVNGYHFMRNNDDAKINDCLYGCLFDTFRGGSDD